MKVTTSIGENITLEVGDENTGSDILLTVSVSSDGYSANDTFWVLKEMWYDFIKELEMLERERQGQALLKSIVPDELKLRLYSTNHAGHIAIEVDMTHEKEVGTELKPLHLMCSFSLSSEHFRDIVDGFQQLVRAG